MNCLTCNKEFIGNKKYEALGYCSEHCWEISPEYRSAVYEFKCFFRSLTKAQCIEYLNLRKLESEYSEVFNSLIVKR